MGWLSALKDIGLGAFDVATGNWGGAVSQFGDLVSGGGSPSQPKPAQPSQPSDGSGVGKAQDIVSLGATLANGLLGANQTSKAVGNEVFGANQAIGTATDVYNRQLDSLAPYQVAGGSATGKLLGLLGLPALPSGTLASMTSAATRPQVSALAVGGNQPAPGGYTTGTVPAGAQVSASGYQPMTAPNGETAVVPSNLVAHYQAFGASPS